MKLSSTMFVIVSSRGNWNAYKIENYDFYLYLEYRQWLRDGISGPLKHSFKEWICKQQSPYPYPLVFYSRDEGTCHNPSVWIVVGIVRIPSPLQPMLRYVSSKKWVQHEWNNVWKTYKPMPKIMYEVSMIMIVNKIECIH